MSKEKVADLVGEIVKSIIVGSEIELVDVEYVRERDWYLRVFLDKPGGIEIEDCQRVSEELEGKLDKIDPIKESYFLEVSSPGLERPLKKDRDFVRYAGEKVEVSTYAPINNSKVLIGVLKGLLDNNIVVEVNGEEITLPRDKVAQVRLHIEF